MKANLSTNRLFGIKKTDPQNIASIKTLDANVTQPASLEMKEVVLEAERKKAQAAKVLRQYTFVR